MSHLSPQQIAQLKAAGPPYPPQGAEVGGVPSVSVDVAPLAVFICLYLTSFVVNMTLFRRNLSKGHKFLPSALLAGFSMARVLTCCLRIGWATAQHDVSLAIAAQIFVQAGILIVYVLNLIFAQRILRAKQPEIGWSRIVGIFFKIIWALIPAALILVITLTVISFYSLKMSIESEAHWIQRGAILFLFIVAFLPLPLIAVAFALPRSAKEEEFGHGSVTTKALLLVAGTCLCCIIAGFRVGTTWSTPRPASDPAWYDSKAAFYVFNFTMEILIISLYTPLRIDKRLHVLDGSSKRKSYAPQDRQDSDTSESELEKPGPAGSAV